MTEPPNTNGRQRPHAPEPRPPATRPTRGHDPWRSLEELAGTPEFQELLEREFPQAAGEFPAGVSRRRFLELMSASLALGGLTACTRQPLETIVPYVEQPERLVPGRPLFFATSMPLDGFARPLIVESHQGRPTKVEGNPQHPASRGATDLYAQASILTLYDPERAQVVRHNGRIRTWPAFVSETRNALQALEALGGARIRILTRTVTSPSLAATIQQVLASHPKAQWHQYTPVSRDHERRGLEAVFGEPLSVRYLLGNAEVVVGLDSDFLTFGPGSVAYARDFVRRRRPGGALAMSRFYAAESSPTATGTLADHRLPLRASQVAVVAAGLAAAIEVPGAAAVELEGELRAWVAAAAEDLRAHRGSALVVPGEFTSPEVHTLAHAINLHLGNMGSTVEYADAVEARPEIEIESLRALTRDMEAGEVDILLILGCNPIYDAPADIGFTSGMNRVARRIHLGLYENETAEFCQWHLPAAHYLESWGDGRAFDGSVCLIQPLIEPLYAGKTATEVLSVLVDDPPRSAYDVLRRYWQEQWGEEGFESVWQRSLHDGFVAGSRAPDRSVVLRSAAVLEACESALAGAASASDLEVLFRPDPTIYDGSFNNNGWLQECPKPLTKLTWDNAALIGPAMAQRLGVRSSEMVELAVQDRALRLPVWVLPGHPDGSVSVHLGHGRRKTGRVGAGSGFNAYLLRRADTPWQAPGGRLQKVPGDYLLASTQLHQNIPLEGREAERRHLVRVGTRQQLADDPELIQRSRHQPSDELSLYPLVEYKGHAWGLSIDLSACTGCNACVVACQAENNIPVVGKQMVAAGREMHWIRIDRYFQGDLQHPEVHHQPVMCMHCEQAPCEPVCPVAATVHSDEGLNDMVYNRCVGTRYCSNNCPYKVRRFNFLKYNDTDTPVLKLLRNPDVTVRTRGVMEKCTYCVQRINAARIEARREHRQIRDGEIQTACQQVCPSQAIVFGDINDPQSGVSRAKADPLSYGILEELGTRPRTTYLAKVRNPSPALHEDRDDAA